MSETDPAALRAQSLCGVCKREKWPDRVVPTEDQDKYCARDIPGDGTYFSGTEDCTAIGYELARARAEEAEKALAGRDAEWRAALGVSHYDSIDGLHSERCADCAPLRALLAGPAAPPPTSAEQQGTSTYRSPTCKCGKLNLAGMETPTSAVSQVIGADGSHARDLCSGHDGRPLPAAGPSNSAAQQQELSGAPAARILDKPTPDKCPHTTLNWGSGTFYIFCYACGHTWRCDRAFEPLQAPCLCAQRHTPDPYLAQGNAADRPPQAIPSCTPMRCRVGLDFHHCESAGHLSNSPPASAEKQEGPTK